MSKHLQKLFALVLVCCALLGSSTAWGQVTISDGSKYAQDFNSLAASGTSNTWSNNTTLPGWYSTRTVYQANNGGSNAGALYSFGTAADDRALGAVQSNTTGAIAYGIQFQNTSGKKIASLKVRYTGEQWRNGGNASAQSIEFSYEVTATAATEVTNLIGSFIRVSELDFTSPITGTTAIALNGNAAENRKVIEHTFDVVVEEGEFISIKWIDANDAGNDHGLSIDDFELTPVFAAPDVTAPAVASFNPANGATDVPTTSNLVITFDENVKKGTGSIELREAGSSTLRASIDVTSENVIVDGKTVTVITSLAAGKNYYVEIPATAFADASGNAFEGISNATTWAFTTSAVVTPVLSASLQNLYFGYVQPNQNKTLSFIVGGSDVTEDITVSVTDGYTLSIEENGTYEASITLAAAEASAGKTVFVKYSPTTTAQSAGVITISSVGATDVQVKVLGTALNGYAQNFDDCSFGNSLVGGWKSYSTIGDQVWECSSFGNNGTNGVQINGFSSGAKENQDYLISPSLDLSNLVVPIASFWTKSDFSGPALSVMISTNYDGVSDPTTATWTILNADLPAVNSGIWKQSTVDLSAYKQSNVHIAFVYTSSTAAGASRWSIDDFSLNTESYYLTTSNLAHNFGIVAPQGPLYLRALPSVYLGCSKT
ncbi:Ig-like domain-containing protein [Pontibacter pudoricolor]|uniref:Ig-like domain-containing protein n=1 Tax=Pontibacter pudoricolor TaxID=2694930 RepID=UPI001391A7CB|nr:Ig-like domain-containing protein [Pontibacter pudoricolor]